MLPSSPATLLRNVLRILVPLSVVITAHLYLYPVFQRCAFPLPNESAHGVDPGGRWDAFVETARLHVPWADRSQNVANASDMRTRLAPFRLLALGDPQLEGDTSIPNAHGASFPHLHHIIEHITFRSEHESLRERVRQSLHNLVDFWLEDIPNTLESIRKRVDLFGNDFYLAHIYRSVRWWAVPTHVSVLGDLLGSQWIEDDEFEKRADRYWNRVVRGGERVPDGLALYPADEYDLAGYLGGVANNETEAWTRRIINVAGNHDIGYAGDINDERLGRFERLFGKVNYELRFEMPPSALSPAGAASIFDEESNPHSTRLLPELRIVNLNDMNLDTPALSGDIQDATYGFINAVINTASAVEYQGHFTLLLTHVPLFKPEGVCVDPPHFSFHEHDGTLQEQNQLSADASRGFLEGIFGMHGNKDAPGQGRGRPGVILNGHDHEGCDTFHYINQQHGASAGERSWEAMPWTPARDGGVVGRPGQPGIREITVRSMMGDFGGNAGLLSIWFDEGDWEWKTEFATCALGRQHVWWAVHILDFATVFGVFVYLVLVGLKVVGLDLDKWPTIEREGVAKKAETLAQGAKPTANGTANEPKALG